MSEVGAGKNTPWAEPATKLSHYDLRQENEFLAKRQRKNMREPEERLSRIPDPAWQVSVLWGSGKVVF